MQVSIAAYINDGALSKAAYESRLDGANKAEVVRFSLLRLLMPASDARAVVFANSTSLAERGGRVDADIPVEELEKVRRMYPNSSVSELVRFALDVAGGVPEEQARKVARIKPSRRPKNAA
ncbi:hypothetical protein [Streptomyces sp. YGL11-2]|uniref:hypothetical protein n=1 Tax=Streptomyces sp. YGL11-2 TaxID=3414028 RepID=UPI003CF1CBAA